MKYTLTNDFHGTSVDLYVRPGGILSDGQTRRAKKQLCGVDKCTCSGSLGVRGPQECSVEIGYHGRLDPVWVLGDNQEV